MSRMYDAIGLPKSYRLESQLTSRDKETIRTCYRDAMYDADWHSSFDDLTGAEARGRMRTLEAIFGMRMFLDFHAEKHPCPYRERVAEGTYVCKLAVAEMKRLGKRGYYDTECRNIEWPCNNPLNPKNHAD